MKKILVIDDDMRYRDVVLPYLQSCDFEVDEAATVNAGFRFLANNKYVLLIVDGVLPDGLGVNVIKQVRDSGNNVPIIFISGMSKEREALEKLVEGLQVSLVKPKPIVPSELCKEVVEVIRKHSLANLKPTKPSAEIQLGKPTTVNKFPGVPLIVKKENPTVSGFNLTTEQKIQSAKQEYLSSLPNVIAGIRSRVEFYVCFPESAKENIGELLIQVHNIKGTAGMHGCPQLGQLMERIETYLKSVQSGTDSLRDDSWQSIAEALRKAERDFA